MGRLFISAVLVSCLGWIPVLSTASDQQESAPDITISTGVKGGGYWSAGERFKTVATEMNLGVKNRVSTGSLENIEQLIDPDGPVNMAFAQTDALRYFLNRNAGEEKQLEVIESIGPECVFIVTTADSDLHTEKDLQDVANLQLGIPSATSGVAVTFDYMVSQLPELGDIEVVYGGGESAMDQLDTLGSGADALMTVHRPKEHSAEVDAAINNPGKYRLITLNDPRLTAQMPDGVMVYRSMNLALPGTTQPVQTICTQGLLLLNKDKITAAKRNQLDSLVNYHWIKVYATP